jgi:hypothetical protein
VQVKTIKTRYWVKLIVSLCIGFAPTPAFADNRATMSGGEYSIGLNERATFPVQTSSDQSTEFSGWCELSASGSASVVVDGRHYIPLSEPAIGDVVTFNGAGTRRFEMTGTFQANAGDAEISFYFASVPVAFCFGGGDCASVEEGSGAIAVSCGQH